MKHNQRLVIIDGIDTAAECVGSGPSLEVRLPFRYVSGYFPSAGPHRDDMAARFLGDVVGATSASVVDLLVSWLGSAGGTVETIPDCATAEVAASESSRLFDELCDEADRSRAWRGCRGAAGSAGKSTVHVAALRYAAAVLRERAVRW